jgi:hypothetical protein
LKVVKDERLALSFGETFDRRGDAKGPLVEFRLFAGRRVFAGWKAGKPHRRLFKEGFIRFFPRQVALLLMERPLRLRQLVRQNSPQPGR